MKRITDENKIAAAKVQRCFKALKKTLHDESMLVKDQRWFSGELADLRIAVEGLVMKAAQSSKVEEIEQTGRVAYGNR